MKQFTRLSEMSWVCMGRLVRQCRSGSAMMDESIGGPRLSERGWVCMGRLVRQCRSGSAMTSDGEITVACSCGHPRAGVELRSAGSQIGWCSVCVWSYRDYYG